MRKCILLIAAFMFQICFLATEAKTFLGYKRKPLAVIDKITGYVSNCIETNEAFIIEIDDHSTFFKFPIKGNASEVRALLKESKNKKKEHVFQYDVGNGYINFID